jgi:hypothetical protein
MSEYSEMMSAAMDMGCTEDEAENMIADFGGQDRGTGSYGWATWDCPTKLVDEGLAYIKAGLEKINKLYPTLNASARIKYNEHDTGEYPSYEIYVAEDYFDYDEDEDGTEAEKAEWARREESLAMLSKLENNYSKKFSEYL